MKKVCLFIFLLVLSITTTAQSNKGLKITGTVYDENGDGIPYASVALYNSSDSSLVAGAATNPAGTFTIDAHSGKYYLAISFLSYRTKTMANITVTNKDVALGEIALQADAELLNEVVIEAEKSQMELKLDKRIFNVAKDMSNKGANAAEVLDNIPSVTVDVEGNVSLRGSENVRILIDGKPSGLTGISSTDALRQLQGDMVEKVEVITNPSARYDAEGEVGIINIVLKKEKRKGINGSIDVNAGYPDNYGGAFNLNIRRKAFNLFTSYGVRLRERPGSGKSYQQYFDADTTFSYDRTRTHTRGGFSNNMRLGTDLYLTDKTTLTFAGMYSISDGSNDAQLVYKDYNSLGQATQTVVRDEDEQEDKVNKELAINYRQTFEKEDQLLTIDFKYIDSEDLEASELIEVSDDATVPNLNQRTSNTENEERYLFQTDYTHPFGEEGMFEIGGKANLRTINNKYKVEELDNDAQWAILEGFNNDLEYIEDIYAAYVMAGTKTGNLSYQLGVRAEYSDVTTNLRATNQVNQRDYLNLFPSAHFSYEFKKDHFLQLSYSRRISRPRFWWLLPFVGFSDSRNLFGGNPNLNPEYTHSNEMGYLKQWEKGSLLSSFYYRYSTGVIDRIFTTDSTGASRIIPQNIGIRNAYGIEFSGSYEVKEWWNLSGSYNFFRQITDGEWEGTDYSADTYAWSTRVSSKWNFQRKFSLQTSFKYDSPRNSTQGRHRSSYNWDAGFGLDVLKGNGTITFSARDMLNTRKRRFAISGDNFYNESEFQWRSRQFTLSFNYRINQKKKAGNRGGNFEDFGE